MKRSYYSDSIDNFLRSSPDEILGKIAKNCDFSIEQSQKSAWIEQIGTLNEALSKYQGAIYFEYSIPRMGKRIDVVLLIGAVIFVLEFKTGESEFSTYASDQVWDYALDLKYFHEGSLEHTIAPILIASNAEARIFTIGATAQHNDILFPILCNSESLGEVIRQVLAFCEDGKIDSKKWEEGRYCPTPTIIEAATALYNGHSVSEISRNDATAINLSLTFGCGFQNNRVKQNQWP